jgi:hypothetical protein
VPDSGDLWQVAQLHVTPLEAVEPGDAIASIVPLDGGSHQPRELLARLELDEEHLHDVAVGQTVRIRSNVHNSRLHGCAEARIERIEPLGKPAGEGKARFQAVACITQAPFTLPLGSTLTADIVVGRKLVYRIILEH